MKKIIFIIPTIVSIAIFLVIIKPGFFNMIPFTIHQAYFRGIIKEITFVYIFDLFFCIILWYILYRICRLFIKVL